MAEYFHNLQISELQGLGSDITEYYLPSRNPLYAEDAGSLGKYFTLSGIFFGTLERRQAGGQGAGGGTYLKTTFLQSDEAILEEIRNVGIPSLQTVSLHPTTLLRVLCILDNSEVRNTRENIAAYKTVLNNLEVTNLMQRLTITAQDQQDNADFLLVLSFKRMVKVFRRILQYSVHRTRLLLEVVAMYKSVSTSIDEAKVLYTDLMVNLTTRSSCYSKIQSAARQKKNLTSLITQLLGHYEGENESNQKIIFEAVIAVNAFSITQIKATLINSSQAGSMYSYTVRLADQQTNPENLDDVKTLNNLLNPLIEGIKSYSETPFDHALSKRDNIKALINESMRKANSFVDDEDCRNISGMRQCKSELELLKSEVMALRMEGVPCGVGELDGYSQVDLETGINLLAGYISDLEDADKKKKDRIKLEETELIKSAPTLKIKELRSQADWLIFLKSANEILPKHQSELVKVELLKKALVAKDDQQLTKNLSSYKQIMLYLKTKYSSESAVPRLIASLLEMKPCRDNETLSYKNLTMFNAVLQQLESHQSEGKLDSHLRSRLLPLLLSSSSLHDFTRKKILVEIEWRRETQTEETEDDDLLSVHLDNPTEEAELEAKKLKFFLSSMKTYLQVARSLSSQIFSSGATSSNERSNTKSRSAANSSRQERSVSGNVCILCHQEHTNKSGQPRLSLSYCPKFVAMGVSDKIKFCTKHNVCKRCLINRAQDPSNHVDRSCQRAEENSYFCRKCPENSPQAFNHHTSLHIDKKDSGGQSNPSSGPGRGGRGGGRGRGGRGRGRGAGGASSARHSQNEASTDGESNSSSSQPSAPVENSQDSFLSRQLSESSPSYNTTPRVPQPGDDGLLNLNENRIFLSCVTPATVSAGFGKPCIPLLCLLDIGSGQGWISEKAVQNLGLTQNPTPWKGQISTTLGTKKSQLQTFTVSVYDKFSIPHSVVLFGTKSIGYRPRLPPALQEDIVNQLGGQHNLVANVEGDIDIILGLDSINLLGQLDTNVHNSPSDPLFSGVRLFRSILSPLSFPSGAVGKSLAEYEGSKTVTFFNDQRNHVQSFMSVVNSSMVDLFSVLPPRKAKTLAQESLYSGTGYSLFCQDHKRGEEDIVHHTPGLSHSHALASSFANQKCADEQILQTMEVVSPAIVCKDCNLRIKSCKTCRYLSSEISLSDRINLEKVKKSISVTPDPDNSGKFIISARFILKAPPHLTFNAGNSQYELVKRNAIRLRQRLIKKNLFSHWQAEWRKTVSRGEWTEHSSYHRDQPVQNFISLNYALKESSSSQPLRIISNSALTNKSGRSLNSALVTAPSNLNSGRTIILRWRLYKIGLISDLSRFYRSCRTGELEANLRLTVWFDPDVTEQDLDPPTKVYSCQVLNYGDSLSSSLSETIARTHISPALKLDQSRELVSSLRYCDDMLSSVETTALGESIAEDLRTTFDRFNYAVKHVFLTDTDLDPEDETRFQVVMGARWDRKSDTFQSAQQFHPGAKERGAYMTQQLSLDQIKNLVINRQLLARLLGQLFSFTGIETEPLRVLLKIFFSHATTVMPTGDWRTPIHEINPDLDKEIRDALPCLVDYHQNVQPFTRCIFPSANSKLVRIVVSSDAGQDCLGCLVHFVVKDGDELHTSLVLATSKTHHLSVPEAELQSLVFSTRQASEIITDLLDQLKLQKDFDLILASDSKISLAQINPSRTFKKVATRNASFTVHRILEALPHVGIPDLRIKIVHIPGIINPADKISKKFQDPLHQVNSQLYREGPPCYQDLQWPLPDDVVLYCDKSGTKYTIPATDRNDRLEDSSEENGDLSVFHARQSEEINSRMFKLLTMPDTASKISSSTGYLGQPILDKLTSTCRTLQKLLGAVVVILKWTTRLLKGVSSKDQELDIAFTVVVRSSQVHYPPSLTRIKHWYPCTSPDGILRAVTRGDNLSPGETSSLLPVSPPCLSSRHKSLLRILINYHHKRLIKGKIFHCNALTTAGMSRTGRFGFVSANQLKVCRSVVGDCVTCRRIHQQPSTHIPQSPVRTEQLLNIKNVHKFPLWKICSADPLGPYYLKDGRKRRSYYLLIIVCLLSKAISLQFLDSVKMVNVFDALQSHSLKHGTPQILYLDAGSSLHLEKHDQYEQTFGDLQIVHLQARHQFLSYCERHVQFVKKIWRSAHQSRFQRNPAESLTFQQLSEMMEFTVFIANSKPIYPQELGLTPNHLLLPHFIFSAKTDGENFENLEQNFSRLFLATQRASKLSISALLSTLKFLLISENRTIQQGFPNKISFRKGDIVLICRSDYAKLGKIVSASKSHSDVLTRVGGEMRTVNLHHRFLLLMHRPSDGGDRD